MLTNFDMYQGRFLTCQMRPTQEPLPLCPSEWSCGWVCTSCHHPCSWPLHSCSQSGAPCGSALSPTKIKVLTVEAGIILKHDRLNRNMTTNRNGGGGQKRALSLNFPHFYTTYETKECNGPFFRHCATFY